GWGGGGSAAGCRNLSKTPRGEGGVGNVDGGFKTGNRPPLPFGHAAGDWDDGAAEPLGAVVHAETAGEQAVAHGDVDGHTRPSTAGAKRARNDVGPDVEIALGVAHHGGLARRAGRGVNTRDLLAWHREQAERIVLAQVVLGREWEFSEIVQRLEIGGADACGVKLPTIGRHLIVPCAQRVLKAFDLQRSNLIARGGLDRLEPERRVGRQVDFHMRYFPARPVARHYRYRLCCRQPTSSEDRTPP